MSMIAVEFVHNLVLQVEPFWSFLQKLNPEDALMFVWFCEVFLILMMSLWLVLCGF